MFDTKRECGSEMKKWLHKKSLKKILKKWDLPKCFIDIDIDAQNWDSLKSFMRLTKSNKSQKLLTKMRLTLMIHENDSQKWFTRKIHKNYSQKWFTKKDSQKLFTKQIHKMIHVYDSQTWFTKMIQKNDSQKWFTKMIHKNIMNEKNDSQKNKRKKKSKSHYGTLE